MEALKRALFAYHRRAISKPRARRVARALACQIGRARSILDVGCGDGGIASETARLVGAERVIGVDVKLRSRSAIEVALYDGAVLPFPDGAFEAVLLADVLHHCPDPARVLRESLRVAERVVAVKDHFQFGRASGFLLLAMDRFGNAEAEVLVRGTYFHPADWVALVSSAGGVVTAMEWPLRIHDYPWRIVTQDRLQFAARIERLPRSDT